MRGAAALEQHHRVAQRELRPLSPLAGTGGLGAHPLALLLERGALPLQLPDRDTGAFELAACQSERRGDARSLLGEASLLGLDALAPHLSLLKPPLESLEAPVQLCLLLVRLLQPLLRPLALAFALLDLCAQRGHLALELVHALLGRAAALPQHFEALLALEHTGVHLAAAIDAQPIAPEPLSPRRDQRLLVRQRSSQAQRRRQRVDRAYVREAPAQRRRPSQLRRQCAGGPDAALLMAAAAVALSKKLTCPASSPGSAASSASESPDADRLEVVTQHRLDGPLPA